MDRSSRPRHAEENRYCNLCQCTTRHEVKDVAYSCLRCGVIKYPVRYSPRPSLSIAGRP